MIPTLRYEIGSIVVPGDRLCGYDASAIRSGPGTHIHYGNIHASISGELQIIAIQQEEEPDTNSSKKKKSSNRYQVQIEPITLQQQKSKKINKKINALAKHRILHIGQIVLGKVLRITPQQAFVEILATTITTTTTTKATAINSKDVKNSTNQEHPHQKIVHYFSFGDCPEGVIHKADIWQQQQSSGTLGGGGSGGTVIVSAFSNSDNNNNKKNTTENKATAGSIGAGNTSLPSGISKEMQDCFQPNDLVLCQILSLGDMRRYFLTTAHEYLGVISAKTQINDGSILIPYSIHIADNKMVPASTAAHPEEDADEDNEMQEEEKEVEKQKYYLRKYAQPRKLL